MLTEDISMLLYMIVNMKLTNAEKPKLAEYPINSTK